MSEGQAGERSLVDQVLDVVVFLPLGAALAAQSDPSGLAERGRRHLEAQVRTARFLGELAVRGASRQVQTAASDLWGGFWAARHQDASPAAPEETAAPQDAAPQDAAPEEAGTPSGTGPAQARSAPGRAAGAATARAAAPSRPAPARRGATRGRELAIPGYDQLSAFQVVQRLGGLSAEELEVVLAYEQSHRRRKTIVSRVEQLLSAQAGGGGGSGKA